MKIAYVENPELGVQVPIIERRVTDGKSKSEEFPLYTPVDAEPTALTKQVSGDHYKSLGIQPVEYIRANNIGYFEGNVIKYVTRWKNKNGVADLEKAKHYLEMLIEFENASNVR